MILVFKHIFYKNYVGLTFWPFIFLKNHALKNDVYLLNHEKIHLEQQKELLIIPFYIIYIIEWLVKSLWMLNFHRGYKNISFEKEAYAYEKDLNYITNRKRFSFIKYL